MKIQDMLFPKLSLDTMNSTKKIATSSSGRSEDLTDSYVSGGDLNRIEQGIFRFLKTLVCEFEDIFSGLSGSGQSKALPDLCVQLPETSPKLPVPEHAMVMLVPAGKSMEETDDIQAETQMKLIISYNDNVPNSEIFKSSDFLRRVVNEARQFAIASAGKEAVEGDNVKKSGAHIETNKGFAFLFSYAGQGSDREAAMVSMTETARTESGKWVNRVPLQMSVGTPIETSDTVSVSFIDYTMSGKTLDSQDVAAVSPSFIAQADPGEQISRSHSGASAERSEQAIVYSTLGRTLSAQDVDILALDDAEDRDVFKKLFTFVSDVQPGDVRIDSVGTDNVKRVRRADVVTQNSVSEHASGSRTIDVQLGKDDADPVFVIPAKGASQSISINEGGKGGTTLYAGYGQGELKSSPMAGSALISFENEIIVSKSEAVVNRLNALLGENANVDGATGGVKIDTEVFPEVSPDSLRLLRARYPEIGFVVQNIAKKIFGNFEELPGIELIGLSLGGNGMVRLDTSTLASQLVSGREETAGAAEGFSNAFLDRINCLVNPYAGIIYANDKSVLSMRAAQKDEGASFQDKEMKREQSSLEKRLNELKLLIERSRSLTEWFVRGGVIPSDQLEGSSGSP